MPQLSDTPRKSNRLIVATQFLQTQEIKAVQIRIVQPVFGYMKLRSIVIVTHSQRYVKSVNSSRRPKNF